MKNITIIQHKKITIYIYINDFKYIKINKFILNIYSKYKK